MGRGGPRPTVRRCIGDLLPCRTLSRSSICFQVGLRWPGIAILPPQDVHTIKYRPKTSCLCGRYLKSVGHHRYGTCNACSPLSCAPAYRAFSRTGHGVLRTCTGTTRAGKTAICLDATLFVDSHHRVAMRSSRTRKGDGEGQEV